MPHFTLHKPSGEYVGTVYVSRLNKLRQYLDLGLEIASVERHTRRRPPDDEEMEL